MHEHAPNYKEAARRGVTKTLGIVWRFLWVIVPCVLAIEILEQTGWINAIADFCAPAMRVFSLPGEAALVLLSAQFSLFSGIATATALNLGVRELTIVFVFMGSVHSFFIESALVKRAGGNALLVGACRLISGAGMAYIVSVLM